jgi:putative intracellular protease/amidase
MGDRVVVPIPPFEELRGEMPREGKETKTIAFVAYPGVALLDLVATTTVLDRGTGHRAVTVGERTEPMDSDTPMAIIPEKRFEEMPAPLAIIVPGGGMASLEAMGNERLLNYLRFAEHGAELVSSVSTGAFVLAAAGLLEGKRATTHPAYAEHLRKLALDYVEGYYVEDGKFLTMAGVSGGIDTTLQLVGRLTSEGMAKRTQLNIEYDPQPPFGGVDWGQANGDELGDTLGKLGRTWSGRSPTGRIFIRSCSAEARSPLDPSTIAEEGEKPAWRPNKRNRRPSPSSCTRASRCSIWRVRCRF